jgi:hypothetical protein
VIAPVPRFTEGRAVPRVRVHVERLVVDGVPLPWRDRARLEAAVVAELARLFGAAPRPPASIALARVQAPGVTIRRPATAAAVGASVARAVHAGVLSAGGRPG